MLPAENSLVIQVQVPEAAGMRALGQALARVSRPGDLIVLTGDLGAGKTTLTQGIGQGLQVRGHVVSPTFTIVREYPSTVGGPALVHVDMYRLGGFDELDALDLDSSLAESVTVVEWGEGLRELLSEDRLEIDIRRERGERADGSSVRQVTLRPMGQRWSTADLRAVAAAAATA